ncbi:GNAT family N-acetyltransferase [Pendulispora albinea]|uniref:GNAT family N-acetyltransferase n=1 Tax=Pendulispora albinea TaxID=2741071 RepID=A0ABZ2LWN4_9BACT
MTEIRPIVGSRDPWQASFERRLRDAYHAVGLPDLAMKQRIEQLRAGFDGWTVAEITSAGARVGFVAVSITGSGAHPTGHIRDSWVDPGHAGEGHERAARAWAERWCEERGAVRIGVRLVAPDPLFEDYPVRGQTRMRVIADAEPVEKASVRLMTEAEYPAWLEGRKADYIHDILRSGALSPEEARHKSDKDFAELLPHGFGTADTTLQVFEDQGVVIGTGWLRHRHLPSVTFGYSLEIHEPYRGGGYGRAAMLLGEHAALAAGDSVFMFDVFGGNKGAMGFYDKTGYHVLEENRSIELPRRTADA